MRQTPRTIAFHTLGCKLNFSETSTISRQFENGTYRQVAFSGKADIYVINSCSVTRNAEKRCKALVRQAMNRNPEAMVAVIGCYSQINPEELLRLPGVGLVLGNADKFSLFEHIKRWGQTSRAPGQDPVPGAREGVLTHEPVQFEPSWSAEGRTRSFLKIQDGCDYFCAYCTIPMARGHSRSGTIGATLRTASRLAGTGMKEIVLSGVNIGDFGKAHKERFIDLLNDLAGLEGIERIRISSIEPDLLHDGIIELVARESRLMPHFHIPLQAGCDQLLKAMGRRYDTALFAGRVEKIRSLMPRACIAADLIVGFPGETDVLFDKTMQFIRDTDLSYVHVFPYSERDNTRAARMPEQVPVATRQHRSRLVHALSDEKKKKFYEGQLGTTARVLWEEGQAGGTMGGFTENYIRVQTNYDPALVNQVTEVNLNNLGGDLVFLV
jgi:threonylcarbamoyladenosine tRNA methylthiotransferase MtaB